MEIREGANRAWVAFYNTQTGARATREVRQDGKEIEFEGMRIGWPAKMSRLMLNPVKEKSDRARVMAWLHAGVYRRLLSLDWIVIWFYTATDAMLWLDRQQRDDARRKLIEHAVRGGQRGGVGWGDTERSVDLLFQTLHPARLREPVEV